MRWKDYKMTAVKKGMLIVIARDFVTAAQGIKEGYSVQLHGLPKFTFHIETSTADKAHSIALALAHMEHQCLKLTGATVQAL